jgi:Integrase core domain
VSDFWGVAQHCPLQIGMVERVIRTLKEECIHCQRFDSIQHVSRGISDWISFSDHRRSHQALDMTSPEAAALAAHPCRFRRSIQMSLAPAVTETVRYGTSVRSLRLQHCLKL